MNIFENMFGKSPEPTQPETPTPEINDDERRGGSLDEQLNDFTDRMEKDDEEKPEQNQAA